MGIVVEPQRITAAAVRGARVFWAAEATYTGYDDLAGVLASLAAERPRRARKALVALAGDTVRSKSVRGIPRMSRADLMSHVRLHSRSYFLQNGVPLVTNAVQLGLSGGAQALTCLAGAPSPLIDAVLAGLAAAGLECTGIAPLTETSGNDAAAVARSPAPRLLLLPEALKNAHLEATRRSIVWWAVAAVASLVLMSATGLLAKHRMARAAEREMDRLRPALNAALAVRHDLDQTLNAIEAIGYDGQWRAARYIARLARALPDSAFLASLRLSPGQATITGYATNSAVVVASLERLGVAREAVLEGPAVREMAAGRRLERFTIRFIPVVASR